MNGFSEFVQIVEGEKPPDRAVLCLQSPDVKPARLFGDGSDLYLMEWTTTSPPPGLNSCDCGSTAVEERPDGLVRLYRCADCHNILGDMTMGHEP